MKQILLATVATFALAGTAMSADLDVELGLDLTQNASDKMVADTTIDISMSAPAGIASLGLVADGDAVKVDSYSLGTVVAGVAVSYGDQGDLLGDFGGKTDSVGGTTLANPNDDGESIKVGAMGVSIMVGLTDVTTDITDVENVQATYSLASNGVEIGTGIDYNMDSEEMVLLSRAGYALDQFGFGLTGTYEVEAETYGFEADVTAMGLTAFVNGDDSDMMQNIGGGYTTTINGMGLYAEGSYNLDSEEFTPAVGASFNF
jgi:hypothetical protein